MLREPGDALVSGVGIGDNQYRAIRALAKVANSAGPKPPYQEARKTAGKKVMNGSASPRWGASSQRTTATPEHCRGSDQVGGQAAGRSRFRQR